MFRLMLVGFHDVGCDRVLLAYTHSLSIVTRLAGYKLTPRMTSHVGITVVVVVVV